MNKLNVNKIGLTAGTALGITYVLCVILFWLIPDLALTVFSYMFHGVDITKIPSRPMELTTTIVGFVETLVFGYVWGAVFALAYNFVDKKFK